MTVLGQLKQDLHDAAEHSLAPAEPGAPGTRYVASVRSGRSWHMVRTVGSRVPVLVSLAVTLAIAVIAVTSLHGSPARDAQSRSAYARSSRQRLIDTIGVLRRPRSSADLDPQVLSQIGPFTHGLVIDRALVRYATTTPWGQKLYFVAFKPTHVKERGFVNGQLSRPRTVDVPETLAIADPSENSALTGGRDLAGIRDGQLGEAQPAGRQVGPYMTKARFVYVVPDGVARVTFVLPRDVLPGTPFQTVYSQVLRVSVPVHGNVAAVQVDRGYEIGAPPPMIWYSASGAVIKRIGDFKHLNRATPEPVPGPETARSRAAEKNPSTPNPVTITPATGTPTTHFTFHFQVLVNEAAYQTHITGPSCPAQPINGFGGASLTSADGLRGHTFSYAVGNPSRQWCPGTYTLSVKLISEAFDHPFKGSAVPFGTATFTVKP